MSKIKKKTLHPSEQKDGEYEGMSYKGKEQVERIETKTGADGIEETHVSYHPRKKTKYFFFGKKFK